MKKLFIYFVICLITSTVSSQVNNYTLVSAPKTPEALQLIKAVDCPVDYFTGTPQISIPIYTIKSGDLNLPIDLSYHPGIKVEEQSGIVGLGWNLNVANMMISRVTKGLPDGYSLGVGGECNLKSRDEILRTDNWKYLYELKEGYRDNELDDYYYNLGFQSGKFTYNTVTGEIIQFPYTDNKITRVSAAQFIITTPDGNSYYYSEVEDFYVEFYSDTYSGAGQSPPSNGNLSNGHGYDHYSTNWRLNKIVSFNKTDSIEFVYTEGQTKNLPSQSISLSETTHEGSYTPPSSPFGWCESWAKNKQLNCRILSEIRFRGGKIIFNNTLNSKSDSYNQLTGLGIYTSANNMLFSVSLLNANRFSNNTSDRLKLEGVGFYDKDNNLYNKYLFTYNEYNALPKLLTSFEDVTDRNAQDMFGYYNGQTQNTHMLATTPYLGPKAANRQYSFDYAQTYTLNKIQYITGGYSTFEYEPGIIGNQKIGIRIKEIKLYDNVTLSTKKRTFEYKNEVGLQLNYLKGDMYINTTGTSCTIPTTNSWIIDITHTHTYSPSPSNIPGFRPENAVARYMEVSETFTDSKNSKDSLKTTYTLDFTNFQGNFRFCNYLYTTSSKSSSIRNYSPIDGYYIEDCLANSNLKSKTSYKYNTDNKRFDPVEKVSYEYTIFNQTNIQTGTYQKGLLLDKVPKTTFGFYDRVADFYFFDIYKSNGRKLPVSMITDHYFPTGIVSDTIKYDYHVVDNKLTDGFIKSETHTANNKVVQTTYKYPKDFSDAQSQKMVSQYCLDKVLQKKTTYYGNKMISVNDAEEITTTHGTFNTPDNKPIIKPAIISELRGFIYGITNDKEKRKTTILSYGINGQPTSFQVTGEPIVNYIWGYNGQYPIAEIKNASYDDVVKALGVSPEILSTDNEPDMTKVNALKSSTLLLNAQITTYAYKPLVGITSKTDPRGITTYYEYDTSNRLQSIKDLNGKILQKFDYHYKQ